MMMEINFFYILLITHSTPTPKDGIVVHVPAIIDGVALS